MSKKKRNDNCCCQCCNNQCCNNQCCDCCCNDCCCCSNNNLGAALGLDNGAWEAIIFWLIACGAGLLNTNSILIILLFLLYGLSGEGNCCC